MDIIPYFTELKDSGPAGRQKINQINRYLGIALAFLQGFAMSFAFIKGAGALTYLKTALILTAGTAFLLWLGDQITQKGIGNGISLLIMAGIIATIPNMFIETFQALILERTGSLFIGILSFALFVLFYIVIIVGIVYIEKSERRIPIQYANQTTSAYGNRQNYIPFKLNSASVMPVILSSVLFTIPAFIAGSAVTGALSMVFNCTLMAPHGGIFVIATIGHPLLYLLAVAIGSVVSMAVMAYLKRNLPEYNK